MEAVKSFAIALWILLSGQAFAQHPIRDFVESVYAPYSNSADGPDYYSHPDKIFTPKLAALLDRDVAGKNMIDADPLCDCQDAEGLKIKMINIVDSRPEPIVYVTLDINHHIHPIALALLKVHGRWKIADVQNADVQSLSLLLQGTGRSLIK